MSNFRKCGALAAAIVVVPLVSAAPASAQPATKVWITGNGVPGAGLPGAPYGTAVTFRAVNTNVFAVYHLNSNLPVQCPAGSVTITGTTTVSQTNPTASTAVLTGIAATNCTTAGIPTSITLTQASSLNFPETSMNPAPPNPPTPPNPPSFNQYTDGNSKAVLAEVTYGYPNPNASNYCRMALGNGVAVTTGSGAAGRIDFARWLNGNPPVLSILSSASSPTLGYNRLSDKNGFTKANCVGNLYTAGDKVQIRSSAGPTTPVSFNVTATSTSGGASTDPLWVEAVP